MIPLPTVSRFCNGCPSGNDFPLEPRFHPVMRILGRYRGNRALARRRPAARRTGKRPDWRWDGPKGPFPV